MKYRIREIYNFFRYDIHKGILNLIRWFPVIWNFRTWDHYYSLVVYRKALYELKKGIDKHSIHLYKDRDVKQMNTCLNLLNRILCDQACDGFSYRDMAFKNHDKKWGEMRMWFEEHYSGGCLWQSHRPNVNTKKEIEQEGAEYGRCLAHQHYLEEQDYELLFKMIRKYSRGWWN